MGVRVYKTAPFGERKFGRFLIQESIIDSNSYTHITRVTISYPAILACLR